MAKRKFNEVIVYEDFAYRVQTKNPKNGEELLYCVHRKNMIGCRAKAKRSVSGHIDVLVGHTGHEADREVALSKVAKYSLRQSSAKNEQKAPRELLQELRDTHGVEAVLLAGSRESLGKVIRRARGKTSSKGSKDKNEQKVEIEEQKADRTSPQEGSPEPQELLQVLAELFGHKNQ